MIALKNVFSMNNASPWMSSKKYIFINQLENPYFTSHFKKIHKICTKIVCNVVFTVSLDLPAFLSHQSNTFQ